MGGVSVTVLPTLTQVTVHDVVTVTVVVTVKVRLINTRIVHCLRWVVTICLTRKLTFPSKRSAKFGFLDTDEHGHTRNNT